MCALFQRNASTGVVMKHEVAGAPIPAVLTEDPPGVWIEADSTMLHFILTLCGAIFWLYPLMSVAHRCLRALCRQGSVGGVVPLNG